MLLAPPSSRHPSSCKGGTHPSLYMHLGLCPLFSPRMGRPTMEKKAAAIVTQVSGRTNQRKLHLPLHTGGGWLSASTTLVHRGHISMLLATYAEGLFEGLYAHATHMRWSGYSHAASLFFLPCSPTSTTSMGLVPFLLQ
ncbi:hypothetical protein KP509_01G103600 [Ceratopteris richardii]|uniref:Uncharacterized protein n=1 Tax=Ceratopteris richardii TaxID=49495 RepID=A0A8T2VFV4_CERRI|nr:hypothetical protein KP509_01G103600 [Ceratopteris richardii]